jgi:UDP-N-acetylglucosamine 2-epimerase
MKIATILGARPQFIKAWATSRALRESCLEEIVIHTGQHYDESLSGRFFTELDLPAPKHHLGVGSGSHGRQTGRMLEAIETVLVDEKPDWVLVYGDTNSTLAGALAAAKLHIPVAHVEAGLRSHNRAMPEEINRIATDHVSELLLCPSHDAVAQLAREGITRGVHQVGDVMHDALLHFATRARAESNVLSRLGLEPEEYYVATLHRAELTDDPERLRALLEVLGDLDRPVVLPLHPRTRARLGTGTVILGKLRLIEPLGYLDMLQLVASSNRVLTDSGGLQKEAYWLGRPCLTLRAETEWAETVAAGWNHLVHDDPPRIRAGLFASPPSHRPALYGAGDAAARIAALLKARASSA